MAKKFILRRLLPWLLVLAAIAALVVFVFIPIYSEKEVSVSEKPEIYALETTGTLKMENDRLLFELDSATTHFQITDKATGKIWYSNPQDRANDKIALAVNKDFLSSTLNVTYTGTGGEVEMNNYTYSMINQTYNVSQQEDGSIRVDYAIGQIEKTYLIPSAITVERYEGFLEGMSKKGKKQVGSNYTLYEPETLDKKENKDEIIAMYPSVTEQALYILKSDVKTKNKEQMEGYFADAGYTQEEFETDQLNVANAKDNNGPVFNATVIYRLDGGDLLVEVPYSELRCSTEMLTYISVLPMFGAAGQDAEGFMLVPEGGGAIINYNNGKLSQSPYYANLYGWDYATERIEVVSETEDAFPVFGMGQEDGSFICIIEGASAYAGINADIAGRYNSYNYVYSKYNVLHFDRFNVSGRTAQLLYMYEQAIPDDLLVQRYRFLEGGSCVDMAKAYGDYLLSNPDMRGEVASEQMPVHVELVGAINRVEVKFGVPTDSVVATTTFDQADSIIGELTDSGVQDLHVRMTGWCNGGVRQRVLTSVRTLGELGGDGGMKKLIASAKDRNVHLSFDGISCFAYDSGVFQGFLPFMHAARFTTREQVELFNYDIITYQQADWMDSYYLTRPSFAKRCAENLVKTLKDKGAGGVAFRDIGNLLSADYYNRDIVTREQVKAMNVDTLRQAVDAGLKVTIKEGNDYAVPYADLITDMNLSGNPYAIIDQSFPFYQIALHGSKNYTGEAINLAGDYQTALLECAEYGAGLNFTFMSRDTDVVQDSAYSCYTAAGYDRWKEQAIPMITRYQTEMKGLNRQKIVGYERPAEEVTATVYEDGTTVYVNYGTADCQVGSVTVPARDYLVERGVSQ